MAESPPSPFSVAFSNLFNGQYDESKKKPPDKYVAPKSFADILSSRPVKIAHVPMVLVKKRKDNTPRVLFETSGRSVSEIFGKGQEDSYLRSDDGDDETEKSKDLYSKHVGQASFYVPRQVMLPRRSSQSSMSHTISASSLPAAVLERSYSYVPPVPVEKSLIYARDGREKEDTIDATSNTYTIHHDAENRDRSGNSVSYRIFTMGMTQKDKDSYGSPAAPVMTDDHDLGSVMATATTASSRFPLESLFSSYLRSTSASPVDGISEPALIPLDSPDAYGGPKDLLPHNSLRASFEPSTYQSPPAYVKPTRPTSVTRSEQTETSGTHVSGRTKPLSKPRPATRFSSKEQSITNSSPSPSRSSHPGISPMSDSAEQSDFSGDENLKLIPMIVMVANPNFKGSAGTSLTPSPQGTQSPPSYSKHDSVAATTSTTMSSSTSTQPSVASTTVASSQKELDEEDAYGIPKAPVVSTDSMSSIPRGQLYNPLARMPQISLRTSTSPASTTLTTAPPRTPPPATTASDDSSSPKMKNVSFYFKPLPKNLTRGGSFSQSFNRTLEDVVKADVAQSISLSINVIVNKDTQSVQAPMATTKGTEKPSAKDEKRLPIHSDKQFSEAMSSSTAKVAPSQTTSSAVRFSATTTMTTTSPLLATTSSSLLSPGSTPSLLTTTTIAVPLPSYTPKTTAVTANASNPSLQSQTIGLLEYSSAPLSFYGGPIASVTSDQEQNSENSCNVSTSAIPSLSTPASSPQKPTSQAVSRHNSTVTQIATTQTPPSLGSHARPYLKPQYGNSSNDTVKGKRPSAGGRRKEKRPKGRRRRKKKRKKKPRKKYPDRSPPSLTLEDYLDGVPMIAPPAQKYSIDVKTVATIPKGSDSINGVVATQDPYSDAEEKPVPPSMSAPNAYSSSAVSSPTPTASAMPGSYVISNTDQTVSDMSVENAAATIRTPQEYDSPEVVPAGAANDFDYEDYYSYDYHLDDIYHIYTYDDQSSYSAPKDMRERPKESWTHLDYDDYDSDEEQGVGQDYASPGPTQPVQQVSRPMTDYLSATGAPWQNVRGSKVMGELMGTVTAPHQDKKSPGRPIGSKVPRPNGYNNFHATDSQPSQEQRKFSPEYFPINRDLISDLEQVAKPLNWDVRDFRDWSKVIRHTRGVVRSRPVGAVSLPELKNPFATPQISLIKKEEPDQTRTFEEFIRHRQHSQNLPVYLKMLESRGDVVETQAKSLDVSLGYDKWLSKFGVVKPEDQARESY